MDILCAAVCFRVCFQVTIITAKSATIAFFSCPPFFFLAFSLLLSFSFVGVILEPIGPKKPALIMTHCTQMTVNFVRLVVKTSPARYTCVYIVFVKFS